MCGPFGWGVTLLLSFVLVFVLRSLHYLSRKPTMTPSLFHSLVTETSVTMGLNPLDRPLNITLQVGCW